MNSTSDRSELNCTMRRRYSSIIHLLGDAEDEVEVDRLNDVRTDLKRVLLVEVMTKMIERNLEECRQPIRCFELGNAHQLHRDFLIQKKSTSVDVR